VQQFVDYEVLDLKELVPFTGNARRHDDKTLRNSVKVHGQYRTIVVRKQDPPLPEYTILAGHGTAESMAAEGHAKARVEVIVCSDEEALAINLMDNRASDVAFYDEDALRDQLEQAQLFGFTGTGWDGKTAAKYINPAGADNDGDEGDPPAATWAIIVECRDEEQQAELLTKFDEEGLQCRPLIA
jgi:hypothetical protein